MDGIGGVGIVAAVVAVATWISNHVTGKRFDELSERIKTVRRELRNELSERIEAVSERIEAVSERTEAVRIELSRQIKAVGSEGRKAHAGIAESIKESEARTVAVLGKRIDDLGDAVNRRIDDAVAYSEKQIVAVKESTTSQIAAHRESVDAQIASYRESTNTQIAFFQKATEQQVTAIQESSDRHIAAMDRRFDDLKDFVARRDGAAGRPDPATESERA